MGAGLKNQIGVFAPLWPRSGSRRRRDDVDWAIKLKSNSSGNWWPIRGQSGVSGPMRGQCRVGMAIKLKYDNDTKLGFWRWSEIKQSPHTKHYYQGCLNLYLPRYITVSYNLNLWELVLDLVLNLSFAYLMFWVIFLDLIAMLTSLLSFIKRWRNLTRVGW